LSANAPAAVVLLGAVASGPRRDLVRRVTESGYEPLVLGSDGELAAAEVIDRAVTWSAGYSIRAVFPLDDAYVEAAAWIADLLAIPGPSLRAATACGGRDLPPGYLSAWTARSRLVPPKDRDAFAAEWSAFPALLKHVGRTASQRARSVQDKDELLAGFAAAGPNRVLLVEEQPLGEERVVESVSVDGGVIRLETTGGQAPEGDDLHQLSHTHAAVLRRLDFGTGVARARYRQLPGKPPTLIAFAVGPGSDGGDGNGERLAEQIAALLTGSSRSRL
jgi:hypothetical protein